ncbi:hypothetical protein [Zobellia roscoffensis]|uniref:hypothetical protein n=1 Tax=Zobellia roscoffensis TaxID=2779508 RepID=UPI00188BDCB5|nr:hypothetical protein [Zobellia roscoffensis]
MEHIKAFEFGDQLYADELPDWESDCPFGHLHLKYGFILTKLNILNETIDEILTLDSKIRNLKKQREFVSSEQSNRPVIIKMRFCTELKIATDDLIALNSLLYERKIYGEWPDEIKLDSIGAVLSNNFTNGFEEFKDYQVLLEHLNGIGNAIKHSFINTESLWYRTYEPNSKIIGFYNHFNKIKKQKIQAFEVELEQFASDYNDFLQKMKLVLKNNYYQQRG